MIHRPVSILCTSTVVLSLLACGGGEAPASQGASQLPEGHPSIESSPYVHQSLPSNQGPVAVVLETADGAGYTYARVAVQGDEMWVAGPQAALSVGDTVTLEGGMGMTDVESSALGRTFETILFVNRYGQPGTASGAPGEAAQRPVTPSAGSSEDVVTRRGEVLEVIPATSYTYIRVDEAGEEMWLAGPEVAVEPGQTITWAEGMAMEDFVSRTLDRTFDVLWFVGGVRVVE